MAELREHANHLLQENERLWARLETNGVENPQVAAQPIPLTRADKDKGPALHDHSDHPANDDRSSDSSPLPRRPPPQNNAEAESRKRPPRQSNRAISVAHRRTRREANRDRPRSKLAREYISARFGGMAPQFPPEQYPFGAPPALRATFYPPVQGPYDMLSSPLGLHVSTAARENYGSVYRRCVDKVQGTPGSR